MDGAISGGYVLGRAQDDPGPRRSVEPGQDASERAPVAFGLAVKLTHALVEQPASQRRPPAVQPAALQICAEAKALSGMNPAVSARNDGRREMHRPENGPGMLPVVANGV